MFVTCNIGSNELLHHIQQSLVGPELTEGKWKVAQFVRKNGRSFELLLEQGEPLIDPCALTLVLNLPIVVESVGQDSHTFLYCLQSIGSKS